MDNLKGSSNITSSAPPCMQGITLIKVQNRTFRIPTSTLPKDYNCTTTSDATAKDETAIMAEKPSGVSTNISENGSSNENNLPEQIQRTMEFTNIDVLKGTIIGKSGKTVKQLEWETKTKIQVGNGVVIKGTSDAVESAIIKIKKLIADAMPRLRPTHFISLPLKDPNIKQKVSTLHTDILALNLPNVDNSLFLRPEKFHFTVGVLNLYTKDAVEGAVKLLKELSPEIYDLVGTRTTVAKLTGLEVMENNPSQAHVLYAKIEEGEVLDSLKKVAELLNDRFNKAGYLKPENRPLKFHATIMNTKYRKNNNNARYSNHRFPRAQPFSAVPILEKFKNLELGTCRIEAIHIARMAGFDETGGYISEGCITLP